MLGAPVSKRGASRMVSVPARRGLAQKPPLLPLLTREFTTWRASDPALQEPTESRSPSGQQVGDLHSHLCSSLVLANCPKDVGYFFFLPWMEYTVPFYFYPDQELFKGAYKMLSHGRWVHRGRASLLCVSFALTHYF